MKLVEILARNIAYWPERIHAMEQCAMGEIIEAGNNSRVFCVTDKADYPDIVTRPQWQAERDRMKAMEAPKDARTTPEMIAAWKAAQGKAMPIEQIPEPTYEQQLWDRVAQSTLASMLGAIGGADFFVDDACTQKAVSSADFASCAADYADAFMAERAKRVGK